MKKEYDILNSGYKILIKTGGNLKDFLPENSSRNTLIKTEKTNIGRLSEKLAHNQLDRTHCRKRSATVI